MSFLFRLSRMRACYKVDLRLLFSFPKGLFPSLSKAVLRLTSQTLSITSSQCFEQLSTSLRILGIKK